MAGNLTEWFSFTDPKGRIFWLSFLLLFAEVMAIRWIGIEVPVIRIFTNLVMMVALVAASAGMAAHAKPAGKVAAIALGVAVMALVLPLAFSVDMKLPMLSLRMNAGSDPAIVLAAISTIVVIIGACYIVFRHLGKVLAVEFEKLPALVGYSSNLLGSIAGTAVFGLISFLSLGPWAWLLVTGAISTLLSRKAVVGILTAVLVAVTFARTSGSIFSPYSKLDFRAVDAGGADPLGVGNYELLSNNKYFHSGVRIIAEDERSKLYAEDAKSPQAFYARKYYRYLEAPFSCAPRMDKILVLGAGSGNDVAFALARGAKHVDAVEIDPVIARFGKTKHPNRPYDDERVTVHVEDARSFLRYSKDKYDFIEFAHLDPGSTLDVASFLRLDNYVYTTEAMKSVLDRVSSDGVVALLFATGGDSPLTRRLYQTIIAASGQTPVTLIDDDWGSVIFLFGPGAAKIEPAKLSEQSGMRLWPGKGESVASVPCTDQWPFLYLEYNPEGALLYTLILLVTVLLPAIGLIKAKTGNISASDWGNMFFLGQSFMLIETKSITQLSLLFGATWIVTSIVIVTVLIFAFAANLIVSRNRDKDLDKYLPFLYAGLTIAIFVDYFFTIPAQTGMPPLVVSSISSVIACLPILFGSTIFSICFRRATHPAQFLAANLLGVAMGGLTENLCILTGTKGLSLVALGLYALSFLCLKFRGKLAGESTTA